MPKSFKFIDALTKMQLLVSTNEHRMRKFAMALIMIAGVLEAVRAELIQIKEMTACEF